MAHELYSDFPIQNTAMSTVVIANEVSEVLQRRYPLSAIRLTSLSIFAQLPGGSRYCTCQDIFSSGQIFVH